MTDHELHYLLVMAGFISGFGLMGIIAIAIVRRIKG